jgi:uncharacterized membrane protein
MKVSADSFFSKEQKDDILNAIRIAEFETSGEIRVHIENTCDGEVMDRAALIFKNLNMHKTELRNGILFYLAVKNRKFAILGDKGINSTVPENFWESIKHTMLNNFREDKFTEGLCKAIEMTGNHLKKHFPYQKNDMNELPDDISFGK